MVAFLFSLCVLGGLTLPLVALDTMINLPPLDSGEFLQIHLHTLEVVS